MPFMCIGFSVLETKRKCRQLDNFVYFVNIYLKLRHTIPFNMALQVFKRNVKVRSMNKNLISQGISHIPASEATLPLMGFYSPENFQKNRFCMELAI